MMCMEDLGATAFACTPSYAVYLAESLAEAGVVDRLKLKAGIHGAEPWTEEMRQKIESILHINCFDIYGLCEITGPGVAQDCIHKEGLHVHADYFYPEVINPATYEACAGKGGHAADPLPHKGPDQHQPQHLQVRKDPSEDLQVHRKNR